MPGAYLKWKAPSMRNLFDSDLVENIQAPKGGRFCLAGRKAAAQRGAVIESIRRERPHLVNSRNICRVGVIQSASETGVKTFTDTLLAALAESTRVSAEVLDLREATRAQLRGFQVLYVPYLHLNNCRYLYKLVGLGVPRVMTVHGWAYEESWQEFKEQHDPAVKLRKLLTIPFYWLILRSGFFDVVTAPSPVTRERMRHPAIQVIHNAIRVEPLGQEANPRHSEPQSPVRLVAYSGKGGGKHLSIAPLLQIVTQLRQRSARPVELHVFGDSALAQQSDQPWLVFHGKTSREQFRQFVLDSDLFITLKTFPDLGYAEMEAGERAIPMAKLYTGVHEELEHDVSGIVARDPGELLDSLTRFVADYPASKQRLGQGFRALIEREKSVAVIRQQWEELFLKVASIQ